MDNEQDVSWGLIRTQEAAFLIPTAFDSGALEAKQIHLNDDCLCVVNPVLSSDIKDR